MSSRNPSSKRDEKSNWDSGTLYFPAFHSNLMGLKWVAKTMSQIPGYLEFGVSETQFFGFILGSKHHNPNETKCTR